MSTTELLIIIEKYLRHQTQKYPVLLNACHPEHFEMQIYLGMKPVTARFSFLSSDQLFTQCVANNSIDRLVTRSSRYLQTFGSLYSIFLNYSDCICAGKVECRF